MISAIFSLLVILVLSIVPVENKIIIFDSPEKVFYYTCVGEIEDIIYGDQSCMVIYSTQNSYSYKIIPRTEKGYQIGNVFSNRRVYRGLNQGNSADILQLQGTDDYYLWATFLSLNSDITVSDSIHSSFQYIENRGNMNAFVTYGFIDDLPDHYSLYLDDKEIFKVERLL